MLRPFRLLMLAGLAVVVYGGFFWVPPEGEPDGAFDAASIATYETAAWQGVKAKQEFAAYFNFVQMLREQHRYTWFRALQAGFYLTRATTSFTSLNSRYERVLPDLEEVARIEQTFKNAPFDPKAAAKAQLNWWVSRKRKDLNTPDRIAGLIADEYNIRYPRAGGGTSEAAHLRTQALKLFDEGGADPDWTSIRDLLTQSYHALGVAIARPISVPR